MRSAAQSRICGTPNPLCGDFRRVVEQASCRTASRRGRRPTTGARVAPSYSLPVATFLIGGGWTARARPVVYGPFLHAVGENPVVACVLLEGHGSAEFDCWAEALSSAMPCTPLPVLVPEGDSFDIASVGEADALFVCGGHTPAYAAALAPAALEVAEWLRSGSRHYAGFSAGAAIAARDALVGGWRIDGVAVCPEDASEDLDEVSVVRGLDLVPFSVDAHAAQWGTLSRLIAAVRSGRVTSGIAIDEDTLMIVEGGTARVAGLGLVHGVSASGNVTQVCSWGAGEQINTDSWEPRASAAT
jgi:cyanophycinase